MGLIEAALEKQGIVLKYPDWTGKGAVFMRRSGKLLYLSAALTGESGRAGVDTTTADLSRAGRALAFRVLGELSDRLGTLDAIEYIAHVLVLVRSGGDYSDMPKAANGFSSALVELLGDAGRHTRAAMGAPELESGAMMLAEITLVLKDGTNAL